MRITPIENGEGHFAAKLRKKGISEKVESTVVNSAVPRELEDIFYEVPKGNYVLSGDKLYIMPEDMPDIKGLGVIRAGVLAGEFVKKRFEPSHALFMSAKAENVRRVLELDDGTVQVFLHGMEIDSDCTNGYTAVTYKGIITGYGKTSNGRLKNKYPKGLRLK